MVNQEETKRISIVTPVFNEEASVPIFYRTIRRVLEGLPYASEIIFVNDGSQDATALRIEAIARRDRSVRYIEFSRNFGKEAATTAGLHAASGDAAIIIDADLQHPPRLIPEFINWWEHGAEIVVGIRRSSQSDSIAKRTGSRLYYGIMRAIADTPFIPQATDYRLLDRAVIEEFKRFTEHERITRGIVDWLGFRRAVIPFEAEPRAAGESGYSMRKLFGLATGSMVAHSLVPLRLAGYLGAFITVSAGMLGAVMMLDRLFGIWEYHFTGTALLATLTLFLVGIILLCMGFLAIYIGHIFKETQNRPIYVIRRELNGRR